MLTLASKEEGFCIDFTDTDCVEDVIEFEEKEDEEKEEEEEKEDEEKEAVDGVLGRETDRALVVVEEEEEKDEEEEEEDKEIEGDCLLVEAKVAPAELANEE